MKMQKSTKDTLSIILLGIIGLAMIVGALICGTESHKQNLQDMVKIENKIDSLEKENAALHDSIEKREKEKIQLLLKLQLLSNKEDSIKIIYKTKYEKIKALPASTLVDEFERVFAKIDR